MRMLHTVICDLYGYTFFSTLYHQWQDFFKKLLLKLKFVFWISLQIVSETFLILRRTERDMIKNVFDIHVKYLLF
jgi:hypothetical protein